MQGAANETLVKYMFCIKGSTNFNTVHKHVVKYYIKANSHILLVKILKNLKLSNSSKITISSPDRSGPNIS